MSSHTLTNRINFPPDGARSFYFTPNPELDIQENRSQILLGTYSTKPTLDVQQQMLIQELIFKANCESNWDLYALGDIKIYKKKPLQQYDWQVINATFRILYNDLSKEPNTTVFLFVMIPATIILGISIQVVLRILHESIPLTEKQNLCAMISLCIALIFGPPYTLFFFSSFEKYILPIIRQVRKSYQNQFVAYQKLSLIPNSMAGFDVNQLANERSEDGWFDPITLDAIPADQVTANHILRFGHYAIPIKTALESMFTRVYKAEDVPSEEIPHPIENRKLNLDEKIKFLKEISAFFAIQKTNKIQACWNEQVSERDLAIVINRFRYKTYGTFDVVLGSLSPIAQVEAIQDITQQILHFKRKQVLYKLLNCSSARSYFDEKFFTLKVKFSCEIPHIVPTELDGGL